MSNSDRLTGPDFLDAVADQSAAQGLPVNAAEFRQRATDWRADQARIEQLEADLARLERQLRSATERARILDKLKTHLQAANEALAWPPPPTPPTRLTAETSNARQQGQAAWQDEWRAAVAAKLSGYGLSEEAAAVFAESELGEYRAGLCDCAENDPADMVDLMMGVALDAIEKWKAESAGRPFGYKRTAPPSAPVGVEDVEVLKRLRAALPDVGLNGWWLGVEVLDRVIDTLAQQPAAVDGPYRLVDDVVTVNGIALAEVVRLGDRYAATIEKRGMPRAAQVFEALVLIGKHALATQHQEPSDG